MKLLLCDCGFETSADEDEDLVHRAQSHALEAHGVELNPQLVWGLISPAGVVRCSRPTMTGPSPTP
jgi:hypothetical protein